MAEFRYYKRVEADGEIKFLRVITTPAQVKTATCEIFIIKQVSKEIMDDMMNVPFKALQEIDKEAFLLICNQKNLLAITSCNSLAGCHISF